MKRLRSVWRLMVQIWHTTKGYIAAVVAFAACPCHLPITLPLLLALTAGTAISAWLEDNTITIAVISTIVFIGGLALAFKWINQSLPDPVVGGSKSNNVNIEAARQAVLARHSGILFAETGENNE